MTKEVLRGVIITGGFPPVACCGNTLQAGGMVRTSAAACSLTEHVPSKSGISARPLSASADRRSHLYRINESGAPSAPRTAGVRHRKCGADYRPLVEADAAAASR